jgi:ABC-type multidrug transport system ATPase subunit
VRFRNLISELSKDRIVILSTHIVSDIETIANRVIMLKDRRLLCNDSPSGICRTLGGKVFETREMDAIGQPVFPLSQRQEDGRTVVRFVCETGCPAAARPVEPNLEDVFLYVYRDQVM